MTLTDSSVSLTQVIKLKIGQQKLFKLKLKEEKNFLLKEKQSTQELWDNNKWCNSNITGFSEGEERTRQKTRI